MSNNTDLQQCQIERGGEQSWKSPGDRLLRWSYRTRNHGMVTVVSQVGQGHCYVDDGGRIFKQSAEQLSHVTERE